MKLFNKKDTRTDEEILQAYQANGDTQLIGILYIRYAKMVYGSCLFYLRDRQKSADAVMSIFEKLILILRTHTVNSFKGWLSFVVRNHCISELRKLKTHRTLPETYLDFEITEPNEEEEQKLALIEHDKLMHHLTAALPELPAHQRTCIQLFFLENKSYAETAIITGYSEGAVRSYIQNGKRNLKIWIMNHMHHGAK